MATINFREHLAKMQNRRMAEKLEKGEAVSIHHCEKDSNGDYILSEGLWLENDDMDFCNMVTEEWIWSIGKRNSDGTILASTSAKFYENPSFTCVFLR